MLLLFLVNRLFLSLDPNPKDPMRSANSAACLLLPKTRDADQLVPPTAETSQLQTKLLRADFRCRRLKTAVSLAQCL